MGTSTTGATPEQADSIWRRPSAALKVWAGELRQRESQLFLVLSLLIGGAVGAIVVAFIVLTERVGAYLYPTGGLGLRRLLVPIGGSLITGFLLTKYFPQARGSGIPQTKTALFLHGGRIKVKTILGRFFCSAAALGCGISLGREGPSVQVGSGLASTVGRRLGLSQDNVKALIPVGAAAALAAAFNTPIAAVLFSLEEIMGDLHAPLLGSVVISAATSWVVLHLFLGDNPLFHVPAYQLTHPAEFGAYAVLGILGGFVSVAFVKMTLGMRMRLRRLPVSTEWWQPAIGGLVVGIIGFFIPQVEGAGYDYVGQVLTGNFVLPIVAALVILKLVATASCYASGNTGGIFGPSLFMGAMLGGAVGTVVHHWFPVHTATAGAYALVGMGATFAGIVRTPLTSVFMIFELTRDYTIVVPLMIANMISFYISYKLQPKPIYEALNEQDGIHLPDPEAQRSRHSKTVAEVMRVAPPFVSPETPVHDLTPHPFGGLYLVGEGDELLGVLRASEVADAVNSQDPETPVEALMHPGPADLDSNTLEEFPHVHADQPVEVALERMGTDQVSMLPVLDRANVKRVRGVVLGDDILRSYGVPAY
ncbi:MAG TPA: chloride channel protein [Bryobacteraceae bacterium]|jgi:CIC family chloride channel protein|nr:chloride channel protein [Bryobacteraceae bacterium]